MVREILRMGFSGIEINHTVDRRELREIGRMQRDGEVTVASLHNICPIPRGFDKKNCFEPYALSAVSPTERSKAVACAKETIDWAEKLGAKAVVLHLDGSKADFQSKKLVGLFSCGEGASRSFHVLRREIVGGRKKMACAKFDSVMSSLEELARHAKKMNVQLGIENPFYYEQMPGADELKRIFEHFSPQTNVGYWHDVGHAQVLDNLGLCSHRFLLETFSNRLIGFHLHDLFMVYDHKPPGLGEFDFSRVAGYFSPHRLMVMEVNGMASPKEICLGKRFLEGLVCASQGSLGRKLTSDSP